MSEIVSLISNNTKGKVDEIDRLVSKRLKAMRIMLGYSQNELSDAVGVSLQQIQKYEKATNRISSGKLHSFSKILDVPISYFFDQKLAEVGVMDSILSVKKKNSNDLSEREVLVLLKSFRSVKAISARKQIINLVRSMVTPGF